MSELVYVYRKHNEIEYLIPYIYVEGFDASAKVASDEEMARYWKEYLWDGSMEELYILKNFIGE